MPPTPESLARENIDAQLTACGWMVQDRARMNLYAGRGVAVREFPLQTGFADYLLFVDKKAVGVIEAKAEGVTLSGVAEQAGQYSIGLPANIPHVTLPLPFLYESTGVETLFRDERDPQPRSRRVFTFHRPETLADWLDIGVGSGLVPDQERATTRVAPTTLRSRFQQYPPLNTSGLWDAQIEAINNLEASLASDKPRALIQMATGSGKTFTAVSFIYRMLKFGKAKRVLFLVDRANLGRQTLKEFQAYTTPDDGRKFTELYNVQFLQGNAIDPVNRVVVTTIQRLFSMLKGEEAFDAENEEGSLFDLGGALDAEKPKEVRYNPKIPIETFDIIVTDECHRSIYNLWRQVLEYFDAHLIGLTATPSKQTFGFFNQNLVMEYSRPRAVADGVNVDGEVYRIRTQITTGGSTVDAGFWVGKREKLTRRERWEQLDEDLTYDASQLDREVVSEGQIRTIVRTYRDRLVGEIFPGRTEVPKTLIFAKDDSHAEDIVRIVREEFGKGDAFCQKITYRATGTPPETLIANFRNAYYPRVAVTVDMIATGTDIKPLEALLFMRQVRSRVLFEQMLGRGTRVINPNDLQAVTPDARVKDRFVIVDAVGIVEQEKIDTQTLERKRSQSLRQLLEAVALGVQDDDTLSSLAGRLVKLDRKLTDADRSRIQATGAELSPGEIAQGILTALEPDSDFVGARQFIPGIESEASSAVPLPDMIEQAILPLAANPDLRALLAEIHERNEQTLDTVSVDVLTEAGFAPEDSEKARATVESFRVFLEQHKDEITALQIIFSIPKSLTTKDTKSTKEVQEQNLSDLGVLRGKKVLTFAAIKELAAILEQPPHTWTTERLWRAYAQLERDRVRGANERRVLADLVSLVRHAVQLDDELVPYPERVAARYREWLTAQQRDFTPEQRWWLDRIAEHIGVNLAVRPEDLSVGEFYNKGGQFAALKLFGAELPKILDELNAVLAP
jgi:type I restriction enzyme R subunit